MKEFNPITRVYTEIVREWKQYDEKHHYDRITQYEIAYKEFDTETGKLIGEGTADFSPEMEHNMLNRYVVKAYDGRVNRNGGKMTEEIGFIRVRPGVSAMKAAKFLYGDKVARVIKY